MRKQIQNSIDRDTAENKSPFKEQLPDPYLHQNHKQPKTRRDFLAQGFITGGATIILPSFLSLTAKKAQANITPVTCEIPQFEGGMPYICIDVGGGMNIAGSNAIVGIQPDGETQKDVTLPAGWSSGDFVRLGITPEEHPNLPGRMVAKYGLEFHRASGILQGMNNILDGVRMLGADGSDLGPVENGVDGLVFCTRTADDSNTNQINTVYMANKAGAKGELVQLIGNQATATGARSAAPGDQVDLRLRPTQVRNNDQASGLLSLGGTLSGGDYLNETENSQNIQKFMDRIAKMSKTKLADLSQKQSLGQIQDVLNCSFDNAKQLFQIYTAEQLNPGNDPDVVQVYEDAPESQASVSKLVLDKIAGAGTITIGGGDYHNRAMMTTHAKDVDVGEAIGRCIHLAATKRENCVIHLYTDGGVAADSGGASEMATIPGIGDIAKVRWAGDSGTRSAALMLVYKHGHDGASLVREDNNNVPRRQVGNFVRGGGVDRSTVIGDSTVNLWKAIMLNYLACQGREGDFETIFGLGSLPPNADQLIRMKSIV